MTQSFHNPHNSRLGKPSDLSDSSNTAGLKRTKGYMNQTQSAIKKLHNQSPTPPMISELTNHGASSSQMRRENTESSGWLELAQMIVEKGGDNKSKGNIKSHTKIPIPK